MKEYELTLLHKVIECVRVRVIIACACTHLNYSRVCICVGSLILLTKFLKIFVYLKNFFFLCLRKSSTFLSLIATSFILDFMFNPIKLMAMIYLVEVNTSKDVRMFRAPSREAAVAICLRQFDKEGLAATIMTCSDDLEGGKLMPVLSLSVPQLTSDKER